MAKVRELLNVITKYTQCSVFGAQYEILEYICTLRSEHIHTPGTVT